MPGASFKDSEDGLIYDMLTEVGSLVKTDSDYNFILGLNQAEGRLAIDAPRRNLVIDDKPTILVHTQSEVEDTAPGFFEYTSVTIPEASNTDTEKFACYEIAGATHDTTQLTNYYKGDFTDLTKAGLTGQELTYAYWCLSPCSHCYT